MEEENIVIRLKYFMESEGISSTQFADKAGIPRPSLSQILSGRNRKISDIIITQIHNAFPNLSVSWLLFGEGDMMVIPRVLKDAESELNLGVAEFEDPVPYGQQQQKYQNLSELNTLKEAVDSTVNQQFTTAKSMSLQTAQIAKNQEKVRKIVSITVFFDDNSFETFTPGKK